MPSLPFTITLGRPSRGELLTLVGAVILVGSAVAAAVSATTRQPPPTPEQPVDTGPLTVTSTPSGASLTVDGQERGTTPVAVAVLPGRRDLGLLAPDAIDEARSVDVDPAGSTVSVSLWRAHPSTTDLKPRSRARRSPTPPPWTTAGWPCALSCPMASTRPERSSPQATSPRRASGAAHRTPR